MVRPLYFNGPGGFLSGNVQSYKVDFSLAFPYFPVRISERNPMPREPLGKDGGFNHIPYFVIVLVDWLEQGASQRRIG